MMFLGWFVNLICVRSGPGVWWILCWQRKKRNNNNNKKIVVIVYCTYILYILYTQAFSLVSGRFPRNFSRCVLCLANFFIFFSSFLSLQNNNDDLPSLRYTHHGAGLTHHQNYFEWIFSECDKAPPSSPEKKKIKKIKKTQDTQSRCKHCFCNCYRFAPPLLSPRASHVYPYILCKVIRVRCWREKRMHSAWAPSGSLKHQFAYLYGKLQLLFLL